MSNHGNPFTTLALRFINDYKKNVIYWHQAGRPNKGKALHDMNKSRIRADILYRDLNNIANTGEFFDGVVPPELLRRVSVMLNRRLRKLDERYMLSFDVAKSEEVDYLLRNIDQQRIIQFQDISTGTLLVNSPSNLVEEMYAEEVALLFEEAATQMQS